MRITRSRILRRMLYRSLARPLLFRMDPETAHDLAVARLSGIGPGSLRHRLLRSAYAIREPRLGIEAMGLSFPNPVGLAAGFDKSARCAPAMEALGFSHVEVGTLTPLPQPGSPRPRVFRVPEDLALVNRLGFNNDGVAAAARRLAARACAVPVGANLGKNASTPLDRAHEDYAAGVRALFRDAAYFAINVSSPNTPGLRQLQGREHLARILGAVQEANRAAAVEAGTKPRPVLVKLAPDLADAALAEAVGVAHAHACQGIIATNTTATRPHLRGAMRQEGGLSGKPLAPLATRSIRAIRKRGPDMTIIGVGGVFTAQDAFEKIAAGASLVQVYTGLIYEGPSIVKRICRGLLRIVEERGAKTVQELVGCEAD